MWFQDIKKKTHTFQQNKLLAKKKATIQLCFVSAKTKSPDLLIFSHRQLQLQRAL